MKVITLIGESKGLPRLKHTKQGIPFAEFTLVTRQKGQGGLQEVNYNILSYALNAQAVCQLVKKGSKLGIQGRVKTSVQRTSKLKGAEYTLPPPKKTSTIILHRVNLLDINEQQKAA